MRRSVYEREMERLKEAMASDDPETSVLNLIEQMDDEGLYELQIHDSIWHYIVALKKSGQVADTRMLKNIASLFYGEEVAFQTETGTVYGTESFRMSIKRYRQSKLPQRAKQD